MSPEAKNKLVCANGKSDIYSLVTLIITVSLIDFSEGSDFVLNGLWKRSNAEISIEL